MVQIPSIPHLKGLDMRNLQYEIRICQKGHNKVTKTVLSLLRFFMRQTLHNSKNSKKVFLTLFWKGFGQDDTNHINHC